MPFSLCEPPPHSPPCTSCCFFHYTGQQLLTASTYLIFLLSYMICYRNTTSRRLRWPLSVCDTSPCFGIIAQQDCFVIFFFFGGRGGDGGAGEYPWQQKLFRIICYLKTMRLFGNSGEQRGGAWALHLKPIRCAADVLDIHSEASEIFSGSYHPHTLRHPSPADARLFRFQPTGCFIDSGSYSLLMVSMFLLCRPAIKNIY